MQSFISRSEKDTADFAREFAKTLRPGDIVAFFGGLGAGKTTFTRYMCEALDCRDDVSSPTFALVHCYRAKFPIYHFDMYRIEGEDDLYSTGYYDYLGAGWLLCEWCEKIPFALPDDRITVTVEKTDGGDGRRITVAYPARKESEAT